MDSCGFLLSMDLDCYVDWRTGACRFDGEEFRNLLRLCAGAGNEEPSYEQVLPPLWEGIPALCQAELRGVRDLVAWDVLFGGPETLSAEEYETAPCFAGDKSLAETADLIQRRVSLYVDENR